MDSTSEVSHYDSSALRTSDDGTGTRLFAEDAQISDSARRLFEQHPIYNSRSDKSKRPPANFMQIEWWSKEESQGVTPSFQSTANRVNRRSVALKQIPAPADETPPITPSPVTKPAPIRPRYGALLRQFHDALGNAQAVLNQAKQAVTDLQFRATLDTYQGSNDIEKLHQWRAAYRIEKQKAIIWAAGQIDAHNQLKQLVRQKKELATLLRQMRLDLAEPASHHAMSQAIQSVKAALWGPKYRWELSKILGSDNALMRNALEHFNPIERYARQAYTIYHMTSTELSERLTMLDETINNLEISRAHDKAAAHRLLRRAVSDTIATKMHIDGRRGAGARLMEECISRLDDYRCAAQTIEGLRLYQADVDLCIKAIADLKKRPDAEIPSPTETSPAASNGWLLKVAGALVAISLTLLLAHKLRMKLRSSV